MGTHFRRVGDLIAVHPHANVIEIDTTEQDVSMDSVLDFILNDSLRLPSKNSSRIQLTGLQLELMPKAYDLSSLGCID